jgi:hypothetical protein
VREGGYYWIRIRYNPGCQETVIAHWDEVRSLWFFCGSEVDEEDGPNVEVLSAEIKPPEAPSA